MGSVFEVRDEVWEVVEPLLPATEPQATGRPRVSDRVAFNAIVFVLVTGSPGDSCRRRWVARG
ncbi:MAG TPA: transposase [Solirubrobacterales bacterium]